MKGQEGLTGSWTKYGGMRYTVIQSKVTNVWACQSCGKMESAAMSPYLWEALPGEYIRVCALCILDDCARFKKRRASL